MISILFAQSSSGLRLKTTTRFSMMLESAVAKG